MDLVEIPKGCDNFTENEKHGLNFQGTQFFFSFY